MTEAADVYVNVVVTLDLAVSTAGADAKTAAPVRGREEVANEKHDGRWQIETLHLTEHS